MANEPEGAHAEPATLAGVAWRYRWLVALGLIAGLGGGAAVARSLPPVYQSSAQISVVRKRPDAVTGVDSRTLAGEDAIAPPAEVLRSSLVIGGAVRAGKLAALPTFAQAEGDVVEAVRGGLSVLPVRTPVGQSSLYKLTYRGGDSDDCRAVLGALLGSYSELLEKRHRTVSGDTIELILREKETLRKELSEKEAAYRAFRERAPLLVKSRDGPDPRQERLSAIQTKRSALLLQKVELEGEITAAERALAAGANPEAVLAALALFSHRSEAVTPGPTRTLSPQDQLLPLLVEERRLLRLHGPKNPEVIAARARVESARRLLLLPVTAWKAADDEAAAPLTDAEAIRAHLTLLRQLARSVTAADEKLAAALRQEQDELRRLASYEIQNEAYQTSIALNRQLYETLIKRLNEVSLLRDAGGYQVELVEPPTPGRRVGPSLPMALAVGGTLGLLASLGLAAIANARPRRRRPGTPRPPLNGTPIPIEGPVGPSGHTTPTPAGVAAD